MDSLSISSSIEAGRSIGFNLMCCVLLLPLPIYCPRGNLYWLSGFVWILHLKWSFHALRWYLQRSGKYLIHIYIYIGIEEWSCFCLNFRLFNFNKMMIYEDIGRAPLLIWKKIASVMTVLSLWDESGMCLQIHILV